MSWIWNFPSSRHLCSPLQLNEADQPRAKTPDATSQIPETPRTKVLAVCFVYHSLIIPSYITNALTKYRRFSSLRLILIISSWSSLKQIAAYFIAFYPMLCSWMYSNNPCTSSIVERSWLAVGAIPNGGMVCLIFCSYKPKVEKYLCWFVVR